MPKTFKTMVDIAIWVLFLKGVALIPVTIYTLATAYQAGQTTPIIGLASCAAGTLAFTGACIAIYIKKQID